MIEITHSKKSISTEVREKTMREEGFVFNLKKKL